MRALAFAALLGLACAAAGAPAASPDPAPAARRRPSPPPAPLPVPIGARTADRVKLAWEAAVGGRGRAVVVSRAAQRVVAATGGPLAVHALGDGKLQRTLEACREVLRGGLWIQGSTLHVFCERRAERWDFASGKRLEPLPLPPGRVTALDVRWPLVALGYDDGVLRVLHLEGGSGSEIAVPGPPIDVKSLALDPRGRRLAVAWVQGSIWWWALADPATPHPLVRHPAECDALAFSPDGARLVEEGKPGVTTLWDFAKEPPAATSELRQGEWVKRFAFTADGQWVARGGSEGLELTELAGPRRVALDGKAPVEDLGFDERGAALVAVDRAGRLTAWVVK